MSTTYIESNLSEEAGNVHKAIASLTEELEAVDWYNQRADKAPDAELKSILLHNRNEEIEHASMLLEWLRRNIPDFDGTLRTYLFKTAPITQIEEAATGEGGGAEDAAGSSASGSLGIGKLSK